MKGENTNSITHLKNKKKIITNAEEIGTKMSLLMWKICENVKRFPL